MFDQQLYYDFKAEAAVIIARDYIYKDVGHLYNSQEFKELLEPVTKRFLELVLSPEEVEYQLDYWNLKDYDPSKFTEDGQLINE